MNPKPLKTRLFHIVTDIVHPETGAEILSVDRAVEICSTWTSVDRWALICHDKDLYTDADEKKNPAHKAGTLKKPHLHIIVQMTGPSLISTVAKHFGVSDNFVELPEKYSGRNALLYALEYLTHEKASEQDKGKHLYADSEIRSNFDFRAELDRLKDRALTGSKKDARDKLRMDVMYNGLTLHQAEQIDPMGYMNDLDRLKKLRADYIANRAPMPPMRISYYIDGPGGIGKNVASRALAHSLFPDLADVDCFYEVGGANVAFENYEGQPVIIWNDRRAKDLIFQFGRSEVFDIFDSHPTDSLHNVKFASVRLVNAYHIVNGIEPYEDFLNGLAGEYDSHGTHYEAEDKGQSYRRFPIILCLRETEYDLLLNKGVAEGTREYDQYIATRRLQGAFGTVVKRLSGAGKEQVLLQMTSPAVDAARRIEQIESDKSELISEEFQGYGIVLTPDNDTDINKEFRTRLLKSLPITGFTDEINITPEADPISIYNRAIKAPGHTDVDSAVEIMADIEKICAEYRSDSVRCIDNLPLA